MLDVEDWAEIRRLHNAEGLSIKEISRRLGVARNTVRSAVRSDAPPVFDRKPRPSAVDAVEPEIRQLLADFPRMPATVIAERIGWDRSLTILKDRVRELRPLYLPADPCQRTEYRPGELAQWDLWFPAVKVPLGQTQKATLPVIVGVSGYSRVIVAHMIPSREAHDILLGHLACLLQLGAVPRKGVYDNEAALVSRHNGRPDLTDPFQRFRGTLGMGVVICKPGDPEAKGLVERAIRYLETSFLPGRRFSSAQDFNAQLAMWLRRANNRVHSTLRCRPTDRIVEDSGAMMALPALLPDPAGRESKRLGRDHWVRVGTCDYSVHPRAMGRRVEVRVDLEEVVVTCAGEEVARHPRSWARHRTLTDAHHGGGVMMARATKPNSDVAYLCRALKAPSLARSFERLAERARAEGWSHEEFLAACLEREVASRQDHGGENRIRAAPFPARKTLEDFDFGHQRSAKRDVIAHLGTLDFIEAKDNVVFLGPPGTGKTHLATGLGIRACQAGRRVAFATRRSGWHASATRITRAGCTPSSSGWAGCRSSSSTRSATSPSMVRPPTCSFSCVGSL